MGCFLANISIGNDWSLCGDHSGSVFYSGIYSDLKITIANTLPYSSNHYYFVARYSAIDLYAIPLQNAFYLIQPQPNKDGFFKMNIPRHMHLADEEYSWQIVSYPYDRIKLQVPEPEAYKIHDGPHHLSPIASIRKNNDVLSTGFHLYITSFRWRLQLTYYLFNIHSTSLKGDHIIYQSQDSDLSKNSEFYRTLPIGQYELEVEYLRVRYLHGPTHYSPFSSCMYGGIFIYSERYEHKVSFCETNHR